jgi:peptidoglycan hydrolase CwlO-like protein
MATQSHLFESSHIPQQNKMLEWYDTASNELPHFQANCDIIESVERAYNKACSFNEKIEDTKNKIEKLQNNLEKLEEDYKQESETFDKVLAESETNFKYV